MGLDVATTSMLPPCGLSARKASSSLDRHSVALDTEVALGFASFEHRVGVDGERTNQDSRSKC